MRIWLCSMSNGGEIETIREKIEPVLPYIDGIIWVLHNTTPEDDGAKYLEANKGAGKIIYRDFVYHHAYSMNEVLYCGIMEEGDLFFWTELMEYPSPAFISKLKTEVKQFMDVNGSKCLYYFGKAYIVEFNENLEYVNRQHYGLKGAINPIEISTMLPNENEVRKNMRPLKRPSDHWVSHYAFYMLYPAGANHALLGLELNGDPNVLFPIREAKRLEFRREMKRRGFNTDLNGLKIMFSGPIDAKLRKMINEDKVWQDYYRYYILNDKTVVHSHLWTDMKDI